MSEATIWQSLPGEQVFGITEDCVFATPSASYLGKAESIQAGADPKEALGTDCVTIAFDKVKSVQVLENSAATLFVAAKGLANDIRVDTGDAEIAAKFLEALKARLGPSFKETRGKASLLQAAPKLVIATVIIAIMTIGGFMAARQMESGEYRESTAVGRRGNQERAFGALVEVLGTKGTLAIGLPLLGCCSVLLWRKGKNRFPVVTLQE